MRGSSRVFYEIRAHLLSSLFLLAAAMPASPQAVIGMLDPAAAPPIEANSAAERQQLELKELSAALTVAEERMQSSERDLAAIRARLRQFEEAAERPAGTPVIPASTSTSARSSAIDQAGTTDDTEDRAAAQTSQIATLNQSKVETGSKFPLRLSGVVLLTTSVSTGAVDAPVAPTAALFGSGSTTLSLRQTVLGFEAAGPHLAGAASSADLHVDFFGAATAGSNPATGGLLRLRTAHAALIWNQTRLFFALDRPLLNPDTPTSLVQIAQPALAWSGNLWNWSPQVGLSTHFGEQKRVVLEGAWIAAPDAPYPPRTTTAGAAQEQPTLVERSRIPGGETRIAFETGDRERGVRVGVGGYVSPHTLNGVGSFTAWAGSLDLRLPLPHHWLLTGDTYRGQGLGGLGGGGYKDYVSARVDDALRVRSPEDVGGWAQLARPLSSTLSWNSAFGIDNLFASQVRPLDEETNNYGSVARNCTFLSNVIWAPRAALLFSFEYRYLSTATIVGTGWNTNIFAGAAGYRF